MTKKCIQCGEKFTLSDSEIKFFESKNLSLPKRCKNCREKNRDSGKTHNKTQAHKHYNSYYVKKSNPLGLATAILSVIVALATLLVGAEKEFVIIALTVSVVFILNYIVFSFKNKVFVQEFDTSHYKYTFYDTKSMVKHYVKHGKQTACDSMEDYLYKANMVVLDKASLSKRQKTDNDLIFFNKRTNEFVVIAKAGYMRTYFIASEKYFKKQ